MHELVYTQRTLWYNHHAHQACRTNNVSDDIRVINKTDDDFVVGRHGLVSEHEQLTVEQGTDPEALL